MHDRHLAFSGTRKGLTVSQHERLRDELLQRRDQARADGVHLYLHHGDCIGADATAHDLALELGLPVILHPPANGRLQAHCQGAHRTYPRAPYLIRNQQMLDACEQLVACPDGPTERLRSGTWSTVRRARSAGLPVTLIT